MSRESITQDEAPSISPEVRSFLAWEAASRDTIDVKCCYIDAAGDLVAGILLSQLVYWWLPRADGSPKVTIIRDGRFWIAKQRDEWWDECRITAKQYDRAIRLLEKAGLVHRAVFRFKGDPVAHVSLDLEAVFQAVKTFSTKGEKPDGPKVKNQMAQRSKTTCIETTPETTPEKEAGRSVCTSKPGVNGKNGHTAQHSLPASASASQSQTQKARSLARDAKAVVERHWLEIAAACPLESKRGRGRIQTAVQDLLTENIPLQEPEVSARFFALALRDAQSRHASDNSPVSLGEVVTGLTKGGNYWLRGNRDVPEHCPLRRSALPTETQDQAEQAEIWLGRAEKVLSEVCQAGDRAQIRRLLVLFQQAGFDLSYDPFAETVLGSAITFARRRFHGGRAELLSEEQFAVGMHEYLYSSLVEVSGKLASGKSVPWFHEEEAARAA